MHPDLERVALLGFHVYPCSSTSRAGAFAGALDAATCDLDQIDRWSHAFPRANWRVVAGPSRLFILDVDRAGDTHAADGFEALRAVTDKYGPLPPRPMTRSGGSGGAALFFRHDGQELRGASGTPAPGIDPHRGRQAIMIPPSLHPSTRGPYSWRVAPWDIAPPPMPRWLVDLLTPPPRPPPPSWEPTGQRGMRALELARRGITSAPPGQGNHTLNVRAYSLGRWIAAGHIDEREAQRMLEAAAAQRGIPTREALDTIRSGLRAGMRNPLSRS